MKEALGPDCFITEDMVCCRRAEVGKAELAMGLRSGMVGPLLILSNPLVTPYLVPPDFPPTSPLLPHYSPPTNPLL